MIPRTIVPLDLKPIEEVRSNAKPRRLSSLIDVRTVIPNDMPIAPCSARMTRCSSAGSCEKRPLRRSGYHMAHIHAGLSTVRRGRSRRVSFKSGS